MKIIKITVDWMDEYANGPSLEVLVDRIPGREELRYEKKAPLYFAEKDGYVSFFSHSGEGNNGGFGGAAFPIKMADGTERKFVGPWSSRAGCMNRAGFEQCVDVSITDNRTFFETRRGWVFLSGAITLKALLEHLRSAREDIWIAKVVTNSGDVRYDVCRPGQPPKCATSRHCTIESWEHVYTTEREEA